MIHIPIFYGLIDADPFELNDLKPSLLTWINILHHEVYILVVAHRP